MSLRFVISDVDGTLVNHAKQLTQPTIDAVALLQAAGVPFTIISARPPSGLAPLVAALKPTGPIAAFNGGTIIAPDGRVIERHLLNRDLVEKSFAIAGSSAATPWIFAGGRWHIVDPGNPHVPNEVVASGQQPLIEIDMTPLFGNVDKLTWVSDDPALLKDLQRQMDAAIGKAATIGQSQTYYLDLTSPVANKGEGVATLARAAGIDLAQVAVLGDQYNDIPMFERAGIAIAMGQAPGPVKAKARYVSTSNDEDGVAHAIRTILLPMVEERA
ncbi:MAG TPA: Cof-type HAD-IIB family hydrolase [Sphingomonas sp.]|nr:Cof-type HAD-IIB family hydrolase [Sphingomonas sp.]